MIEKCTFSVEIKKKVMLYRQIQVFTSKKKTQVKNQTNKFYCLLDFTNLWLIYRTRVFVFK